MLTTLLRILSHFLGAILHVEMVSCLQTSSWPLHLQSYPWCLLRLKMINRIKSAPADV